MFQIDLKSSKTVCDQIVDHFKSLIETRTLKSGDSVSSVRDMAMLLTINPNTLQSAYLKLESQGYFYTEDGVEWFIAAGSDRAGLYGRLYTDLKDLILKGNREVNIGRLVVMKERPYVQVKNLDKYFDDFIALDKLNLNISKGSIYGLIGANGSGKTTLVKHLAGIYKPDKGRVTINSVNAYDNAHKKVIGYMPEDMYVPRYNMKMLSNFFISKHKSNWNNRRYQRLLEMFELDEHQSLKTFSTGMQKQAGFIFSVSIMPDVLLLDETIDGLDPVVRKHVFQQIIADVASRSMTVLITSHNMRDLGDICDTIGIIDKGRMLVEEDLEDLRSSLHKIHVSFNTDSLPSYSPYDDLDILHIENTGVIDILVVRGKEEEIARHIKSFNPSVYYHIPLSLEEIFVYERSGGSDD